MAISYGEALPDSESLVTEHTAAWIGVLPTLSSFISLRADLEREHGRRLSDAASKARMQAINDATARVGGTGSNTLEDALMRTLELADKDARAHLSVADKLAAISHALAESGKQKERIRQKHHSYAQKLFALRDESYSEREAAKKRYFDACERLESSRAKQQGGGSGGGLLSSAKDASKAARTYEHARTSQGISKNDFLLATTAANAHKLRLYEQDLPDALDDAQVLERSTIRHLCVMLRDQASAQLQASDELHRNAEALDHAVAQVDVDADQAAWAKLFSSTKLASFELPRDLAYEESPVWHEDGNMSTTDEALTHLVNVKSKALARVADLQATLESKAREGDGLRKLLAAYENDRQLGDPSTVLESVFDNAHDATPLRASVTDLEATIDHVREVVGTDDEHDSSFHAFKGAHFVSPVDCPVCDARLWGKALKCSRCHVGIHAKCELRVSANCGQEARPITAKAPSARSSLQLSNTRSSFSSSRVSVASRTSSDLGAITTAPGGGSRRAKVLYDFDGAAGGAQVAVSAGDTVSVLKDDEAGWLRVQTTGGKQGLVPTSYCEILDAPAAAVATGGAQAVALYDYQGDGRSGIAIKAGERLALASLNLGYGEGWSEVRTQDGRQGVAPSSYLRFT